MNIVIVFFLTCAITLINIYDNFFSSLLISSTLSLIIHLLLKRSSKQVARTYRSRYLFAVFISLVWLYILYYLTIHNTFELANFSHRTIGIATLEGLDVVQRSSLYILLIISSIFIFKSIVNKNAVILSKKEVLLMYPTALIATFSLGIYYIKQVEISKNIFEILLYLLFLQAILFITRRLIVDREVKNIFSNTNLVFISFLSPIIIFFVYWILSNGNFGFDYRYYQLYFLLWVLYWIGIYFYHKFTIYFKTSYPSNRLIFSAIPLLFIPITVIVSSEIQYLIKDDVLINTKHIILIIWFLLLMSSLVIWTFYRSSLTTNVYANIYLPVLIISITAFASHVHTLNINHIDMFHHGENLIPTQQLFNYAKIPFIDTYPTHGLSSQFSQILYSLLNGYSPFEPWAWEWVIKCVEIALLYFILKKIVNPINASLLIVFTPLLTIFGGGKFNYGYSAELSSTYYFIVFAAALTLVNLIKRKSHSAFLIHWIACFIVLLWRVDFGIAVFISTLVFIYINRNIFRYNLLTGVRTLVSIALMLLVAALYLSTTRGLSLLNLISLNLEFVNIQAMSQGLIDIGKPNINNFLQYLIFPSIGIFYLAYKPKKDRPFKHILLFLALFSLIVSIRSLQRHTIASYGLNSYLFILLGLSIPFYVDKFNKKLSLLLLVIILFISLIFSPKLTYLLKGGRQFELKVWNTNEKRILIDTSDYDNIISFINNSLGENQTFFDLSSSPLFYIFTDKEFVPYFIPSTYYTSEKVQTDTLNRIQNHSSNKLPLVLMKQPDPFANAIDDVPNEIRSYKIYEYIYREYSPFVNLSGYVFWKANSSKLNEVIHEKINFKPTQDFNLKKLPYIWGNYDPYNGLENEVADRIISETVSIDAQENITFDIATDIDKSRGNYLLFSISSANQTEMIITYGSKDQSSIKMVIMPDLKGKKYLIRISSQYLWNKEQIPNITIKSFDSIIINSADILIGD